MSTTLPSVQDSHDDAVLQPAGRQVAGAPAAQPEPVRDSYIAPLDGLRTVAVYLVLAFHAGWQFVGNGYLGVDIFFVLSGFLITTVLLREWHSTRSISLRRFYARRIRRLAPASLVVLTVGAVAVLAVMAPISVPDALDDIRSALLWVANWHFIAAGNDYFNAENDSSPFLHFWSLAVEEQYYLVWPAVMVVTLALGRRRLRRPSVVLVAMAAVGIVLSFGSALYWATSNPMLSYYGAGSRAYQLMVGGLLALVLDLGWVRAGRDRVWSLLSALSLAALLLVSLRFVGMAVTWRGAVTTVLTGVLIAGLVLAPRGPVARFFSLPLMTGLGKISYGTYLWHLPVIFVLGETLALGARTLTVVAAVIATALASLSAEFLENPIRTNRSLHRRPLTVVAVGVAASVLLAAFVVPSLDRVPRVTATGASAAAADAPAGAGAAAGPEQAAIAAVDWKKVKSDGGTAPSCLGAPATDCVVVQGGPKALKVNIAGDSHARSLIPVLTEIAKTQGWTLSVTVGSGCPWHWGLLYPRSWGQQTDDCVALQNDWYQRVLPELKPDVTLLMTYSFTDPNGLEEMRPAEGAGAPLDELLRRATQRSVSALEAIGSRVVIINPLPVSTNGNPLKCLSQGRPLASCDFSVAGVTVPAEKVYAGVAASAEHVAVLDLDRVSCPQLPVCREFVDGQVVRRDHNHVTATYWVKHQDQVLAELTKAIDRSA